MAELKVFAIFDLKAACYTPPMVFPHSSMAIRSFGDIVSQKDTPVGLHPEDYALHELGTFDNCSGLFVALNVPHPISNALDFVIDHSSDSIMSPPVGCMSNDV